MTIEKPTAEKQFRELKEKYPGCILFFRMGDFYELFDDDAKEMSRVIGLTLTSRDKGEVKRPMAGIPVSAIHQYLGKIVKLGYKVAIAEQMEDPKLTKGIVKRDVVKVITAGNLIDERNLSSADFAYILGIYEHTKGKITRVGVSWCESSTGEFIIRQFEGSRNSCLTKAFNLINNISPKEIVCTRELKIELQKLVQSSYHVVDNYAFEFDKCNTYLCNFFKTNSLKGFGIDDMEESVCAASNVLSYLKDIQMSTLSHITKITPDFGDDNMEIDFTTLRNLEILTSNNIRNGIGEDFSLLHTIDRTFTPMGKRQIQNWLSKPLVNYNKIISRQNIVEIFVDYINDYTSKNVIVKFLSNIYDIERFAGRIGMRSILPKDLVALKSSLESSIQLSKVTKTLKANHNKLFELLHSMENISLEIVNLIGKSILENPQADIMYGDIFQESYHHEIVELRNLKTHGKDWLLNFQKKEIENTGIYNLKVKFNNVFGYFIEISNSQKDKAPSHYIRKQTLVNAERYITAELKEMEDKILSAEEKLNILEKSLYLEFRENLVKYIEALQKLSSYIASIDVLNSFAQIAIENKYIKPILLDSGKVFHATELRHPVVERNVNQYTANDIDLTNPFVILTGPNMSGKSTYIRSIALVSLLAQIGSYVPAKYCELSIVDRIFTRIGASDNLSTGESTFMVEMNETANILNNATDKSLVILDEVGRGTSTYDGVAIAWSVVKYLHTKIQARTLFATHYHELTKLEELYKGIENYSVSIYEKDDNVVFLHKIVKGPAQKSFGVHVARLAGLPNSVISEANEILARLEKGNLGNKLINTKAKPSQENVRNENLYDNSLLSALS